MLGKDSNLVWKCSYQWAAIYFGFVFSFHEESQQFPLSFDKYWSPSNEVKAILFQDVIAVLDHLWAVIVKVGTHEKTKRENEIHPTLFNGIMDYLDVSHHSSRLHPASDIHSVAPDVIVRLTSSNHSSQNSSFIETWISSIWKKNKAKSLINKHRHIFRCAKTQTHRYGAWSCWKTGCWDCSMSLSLPRQNPPSRRNAASAQPVIGPLAVQITTKS